MLTVDELKGYTILFVDDEEKARKYFSRAYAEQFTVITAESVDEAIAVLNQCGGSIGLLITDQRMPGKQGVDLLKYARSHYPNIVRVLTTAFTNLDDAIEAVNRGEIFRYITKPWDIRSLQAELISGLSYFHVNRERDLLLREKLSIWQRMKLTNFARDLIVMSGSLSTVRNALPAIDTFLKNYSKQLIASTQRQDIKGIRDSDPWLSMQEDIQRQLELDRLLNKLILDSMSRVEDKAIDAKFAIERAVEKLHTRITHTKVDLKMGDGQLNMSTSYYESFLDIIVKYIAATVAVNPNVDIKLHLEAVDSDASSHASDGAVLKLAFAKFDHLVSYDAVDGLAYILALYFLTYNRGGRIRVHDDSGSFLLEVYLAREGAHPVDMPLSRDWLEDVFAKYENWGEFGVN